MATVKRTSRGAILPLLLSLFLLISVTQGAEVSLSSPTTPDNISGKNPDMVVDSDGNLWIATVSASSNRAEFFRSQDGTSWAKQGELVGDSAVDIMEISLAFADGVFWFAYSGMNANIAFDIYVVNSTDTAQWSSPVPVTNFGNAHNPSLIAEDIGGLLVAFTGDSSGLSGVWITRSSDGLAWTTPLFLFADGNLPCLVQNNTGKYVMAYDVYDGADYNIYVSTSGDGTIWAAPTRATDEDDRSPRILQDSEGEYHIAFFSEANGRVYLTSSDSLTGWGTPVAPPGAAYDFYPTSFVQDSYGAFQLLYWDGVGAIRLAVSASYPVAEILSISPNPATAGSAVMFSGSGTDSDGQVVFYIWKSDIDGVIGTAREFTSNALSPGTHTITLEVTDNDGYKSLDVAIVQVGQSTSDGDGSDPLGMLGENPLFLVFLAILGVVVVLVVVTNVREK